LSSATKTRALPEIITYSESLSSPSVTMIARFGKARTVATAAILSSSGLGSSSTVRSFTHPPCDDSAILRQAGE
jgi:hypothetical protein